ncbi:hypothetical protein F7725_027608 [Dissostichus mawsoni]|uniref:Uncharacterized protein n=1 Tax=Dissostichus mawsoni TaxID=36200 RepID=A0A7J5XDH1_DISMA|nr:hypothetical protein F7725_027608 [Dissostichus mawsoni]
MTPFIPEDTAPYGHGYCQLSGPGVFQSHSSFILSSLWSSKEDPQRFKLRRRESRQLGGALRLGRKSACGSVRASEFSIATSKPRRLSKLYQEGHINNYTGGLRNLMSSTVLAGIPQRPPYDLLCLCAARLASSHWSNERVPAYLPVHHSADGEE